MARIRRMRGAPQAGRAARWQARTPTERPNAPAPTARDFAPEADAPARKGPERDTDTPEANLPIGERRGRERNGPFRPERTVGAKSRARSGGAQEMGRRRSPRATFPLPAKRKSPSYPLFTRAGRFSYPKNGGTFRDSLLNLFRQPHGLKVSRCGIIDSHEAVKHWTFSRGRTLGRTMGPKNSHRSKGQRYSQKRKNLAKSKVQANWTGGL